MAIARLTIVYLAEAEGYPIVRFGTTPEDAEDAMPNLFATVTVEREVFSSIGDYLPEGVSFQYDPGEDLDDVLRRVNGLLARHEERDVLKTFYRATDGEREGWSIFSSRDAVDKLVVSYGGSAEDATVEKYSLDELGPKFGVHIEDFAKQGVMGILRALNDQKRRKLRR